jgi:hypothetical protein
MAVNMEKQLEVDKLITQVREMYARDLGDQHIEILYQSARRTMKGQEFSPTRVQEESLGRLTQLGFGVKHESRTRGTTFDVNADFIPPSLMLPGYHDIFRYQAGRNAERTREEFADTVRAILEPTVVELLDRRGIDALTKFEAVVTDRDIARTPSPELETKAVMSLVDNGCLEEEVKTIFFGLLGQRREYKLTTKGKSLLSLAEAFKELMDLGVTFILDDGEEAAEES